MKNVLAKSVLLVNAAAILAGLVFIDSIRITRGKELETELVVGVYVDDVKPGEVWIEEYDADPFRRGKIFAEVLDVSGDYVKYRFWRSDSPDYKCESSTRKAGFLATYDLVANPPMTVGDM